MSGRHLAVLLAVAADAVESRMRRETMAELVWSGPEPLHSHCRDTLVVLDELFSSAERSVIVSTFVIHQPHQVFATLAARLDAVPALSAKLFVNIERKIGDTRLEGILLYEYARLLGERWPGSRRPEVYFDPRGLSTDDHVRAAWHAKCVVVDDEVAFVTSANFTEWAQWRNVEAGALIRSTLIVKGRPLRYRDTTKSALEIGRELAVDYLVETSMSAEGDRVRLTTRLLRVRDEEHVWSQTFEREATNLLVLQQELSSAIAEQIRITLSPGSLGGLARRQTKNAEAYDAYLRARYLAGQRTPSANAAAIEQYRRATTIDRDYALAWSALAQTYAASTMNADAPPLEMGPRAREAAANALRSNADLAETQMAAGYVNWLVDWNWSVAEIAFRRAIHLDASNGAAYRSLGHALSQAGRREESEDAMRRARELEPLDPVNHALSSQVAFQNRDYDAAAEHAHRAVIMAPTFWIGSMQLAQVRAEQGQTDLALAALADTSRFSAGNSKATSLRGYILARQGATAEALAALRQLEDDARARYMPPYAMALIHAGLGERDRVFGWLDAAYAARDVHLIFLTVDPKWDPYRTDPRFIALLRACGFGT